MYHKKRELKKEIKNIFASKTWVNLNLIAIFDLKPFAKFVLRYFKDHL